MANIERAIDFEDAPTALPCPFCGCKDIVTFRYKHSAGMRYGIMCMECIATIDPGWVQQSHRAIELWNTRSGGAD